MRKVIPLLINIKLTKEALIFRMAIISQQEIVQKMRILSSPEQSYHHSELL
jgi:hypothetical protein